MFHTQEYGTIQHEVKAQKMGEKSFLENSYMILKQLDSAATLVEWIRKQRQKF